VEPQVLVASYALVVGLMVGGLWVASLGLHRVPELTTKPWEIRFHLAAESILALTLIGGGVATVVAAPVGPPVLLIGLGMTLYSIVNSSGYYVERRERGPVVMFGVLLVLTLIAALAQVAIVLGAV
jgi:hypothetical protein